MSILVLLNWSRLIWDLIGNNLVMQYFLDRVIIVIKLHH